MKEKDLNINDFAKRCMNDTWADGAKQNNEWYKECLKKSKDTSEFLKLYFTTKDKEIIFSQAYGELLRRINVYYKGFSKYVSNILNHANKTLTTESDRGDLKIGNKEVAFYVANRYGDGYTNVYFFEKSNEWIRAVEHLMDTSMASVIGKFDIFEYDCGDKVLCTIEGNYNIYSYCGNVVFIENN